MIPRIVKRVLVSLALLAAMCGRQERAASEPPNGGQLTADQQPISSTLHPILDAAPRSSQPAREDGARPAVKPEAAGSLVAAASADAKPRSERNEVGRKAQDSGAAIRRAPVPSDGARPRATSRVLSLVDIGSGVEPERVVVVHCDPRDREFCAPPLTFEYPQSPYPLNAPVKFAGEVTTPTGYVTHWRYAKATEIRPCSAVERAAYDAYRTNPCDAKVGEDLRLDAPFRIVEPGQ